MDPLASAEKKAMDASLRKLEWDCLLSKNVHEDMQKMKQYSAAFVSGCLLAAGVSIVNKNPLVWASSGWAFGAFALMSSVQSSDSVRGYYNLQHNARGFRKYKLIYGDPKIVRRQVEEMFEQKRKLDMESGATLTYVWTRAKRRLAYLKREVLEE
jgi:hypothetical protein